MLLALTSTALPDLISRGVGVGVGVIPFSPFAIALQRAGGWSKHRDRRTTRAIIRRRV